MWLWFAMEAKQFLSSGRSIGLRTCRLFAVLFSYNAAQQVHITISDHVGHDCIMGDHGRTRK
ncbi:hypothetical protein LR48_Vigan03g058100 [Vigna angularis]|uniref:Uncharacterized protein n=1 Tax=Phaseolus angularis TaxID=3914 RepID=A0A0L9U336_PHAAN|nr:hypothetical protein LR48_Vigan03g058100 [Vigna angularis]